ncbi:MAG TPA: CbiX/SirB N-terminal domain-containing protein [Lacipirellula sp.]
MDCDVIRAAYRMATYAFLTAALLIIPGCTSKEGRLPIGPANVSGAELGRSLKEGGKTAILLVSHGSHSPQWRQMLLDFHDDVEQELLSLPGIHGVKSAFMEYTEPSIATQLRAFDAEGYDAVILVPLLLTVSGHSFDDIPTIVGLKDDAATLLTLKAEGIDRYEPRAKVEITPLLDFSALLESNLPRRIAALSRQPSDEGIVLVAYGDQDYNEEWEAFFDRLDNVVREKTGVAEVRHCWCGHIVHYSPQPAVDAIRQTLQTCERAIVIPVLVARDEYFQEQVIAAAVKQVDAGLQVAYAGDAILPDEGLNEWVVSAVRDASIAGSDPGATTEEQRP